MPLTNGQIVNIVRECVTEAEAEARATGLNSAEGTANFDCAVIRLDHPRPTLARALRAAGFNTEWRTFRFQGRGYAIYGWDGMSILGFSQLWTAFCEHLAKRLEARGVPASVRYMMD